MTKPILLAVHERPRELATIERELRGRYASDDEVFAEASGTAALDRLAALREIETSVPGVVAAEDVRHGSIKRVASAVGEGANRVQQVHRYLSDLRPKA